MHEISAKNIHNTSQSRMLFKAHKCFLISNSTWYDKNAFGQQVYKRNHFTGFKNIPDKVLNTLRCREITPQDAKFKIINKITKKYLYWRSFIPSVFIQFLATFSYNYSSQLCYLCSLFISVVGPTKPINSRCALVPGCPLYGKMMKGIRMQQRRREKEEEN